MLIRKDLPVAVDVGYLPSGCHGSSRVFPELSVLCHQSERLRNMSRVEHVIQDELNVVKQQIMQQALFPQVEELFQ